MMIDFNFFFFLDSDSEEELKKFVLEHNLPGES